MEEIPATKFTATCLAVMDWFQKTPKPVRITRYGKPVADLVPAVDPKNSGKRQFGRLAGKLIIKGDIVSSVFDSADWACLKD